MSISVILKRRFLTILNIGFHTVTEEMNNRQVYGERWIILNCDCIIYVNRGTHYPDEPIFICILPNFQLVRSMIKTFFFKIKHLSDK